MRFFIGSRGGGTHIASTSEAKHFVLLEEKGADPTWVPSNAEQHRKKTMVDPFKFLRTAFGNLSKMIYDDLLIFIACIISPQFRENGLRLLCVLEALPRECGGSLQRLEQWQRQLSRISDSSQLKCQRNLTW